MEKNKVVKNSGQNPEEIQTEHYGLSTATTMIIGIVIGSGIFFKGDDVLGYTGGNLWLGVLVFCIGAFGIIFGSLTLTELSIRTKKNGGFVGYYEEFISKKVACGFGWFQTFVYYPTLIAIVSWVAGIYSCILLGLPNKIETEMLFALAYTILLFAVNIGSIRLGGCFQNLTTVIKLIPLLGIALIGLFWTGAAPALPEGVALVSRSNVGMGWLAALAPIAFSFDGWIIVTSITNEVKNPNKNMTLALIIGPLIVLGVYVSYFIGINRILGAEFILSTGDAAIDMVGKLLLGRYGSRILLAFVLISILGVLNGVILGGLRMPQAMATKNMIPDSQNVARIHPSYQLSLRSCLITFVAAFFWMMVHFISQKTGALAKGDIGEIAISFSYGCYIILYSKVLSMKKEGIIKSRFKGIVCPILGIIGSSIIFMGGFITNPRYVSFFILFCIGVCYIGYLYYTQKSKKSIEVS